MKVALLLLTFMLTGCGSQIEDFVRGPEDSPLNPATNFASSKAIKISPGHVRASGVSVSAVMTITPTDRSEKGSSVDAKVSLHHSRVL